MTDSIQPKENPSADKASMTLPGVVEKIIPSIHPAEPEKAQIAVEGADHLYREIRVDNVLVDSDGKKVALKPGAEVEVKIEAEPHATKETVKPAQNNWQ
jgi:hypothetical protein